MARLAEMWHFGFIFLHMLSCMARSNLDRARELIRPGNLNVSQLGLEFCLDMATPAVI